MFFSWHQHRFGLKIIVLKTYSTTVNDSTAHLSSDSNKCCFFSTGGLRRRLSNHNEQNTKLCVWDTFTYVDTFRFDWRKFTFCGSFICWNTYDLTQSVKLKTTTVLTTAVMRPTQPVFKLVCYLWPWPLHKMHISYACIV